MTTKAAVQDASLKNAFLVFNKLSQQLAASYHELELQVAQLHQELAAAREERLQQFAEKERIANRLQLLWKSLPGGVIVLDNQNIIQECNPTAVAILGLPLLGLGWHELIEKVFVSYSQGGKEVGLSNGRFVHVSIQPLTTEPGRVVLFEDVTDARELRETAHRQERLSAMGEMVARLAHQIRTPLASALLYAHHLQRINLTAGDQQRFAERLSGRLHHLESMVNDMLVFAKGEDECVDEFLLTSLLPHLRQNLHAQLHTRAVEFLMNNNAKRLKLRGNAQALLGALTNLVSNSIQALSNRIVVDFSIQNEKFLNIVINDDGCGIPVEVQERIFDPFYTTRVDGTGLGLAVVRAAVASFNGGISVTSEVGSGCQFDIQIPITENQVTMLSSDRTQSRHNVGVFV